VVLLELVLSYPFVARKGEAVNQTASPYQEIQLSHLIPVIRLLIVVSSPLLVAISQIA
jgi:hypothetical protein